MQRIEPQSQLSLSLPFIFSVAFEFVGSARGVNWGRSSSGDGQVSRGKRAALTKRNWRKKARLEKRVESAYDSHGLLSFPERENRGEKSTIRLSSEIQRTRRNLSGVVCAISVFSRLEPKRPIDSLNLAVKFPPKGKNRFVSPSSFFAGNHESLRFFRTE